MTGKMASLVALSALVATSASAQSVGSQSWIPDLSGVYRCVQKCAGLRWVRVTQNWRDLDITNETGQSSKGWIERSGHIGTSWNDSGVYSPDGFTIQFNGGTVWVLVDPMRRTTSWSE